MIVAAHQPSYLPWLGYLDKLAKADLFVVMDDLAFEPGTSQHRQRIRRPTSTTWLTVPVGEAAGLVKDIPIDNSQQDWQHRTWASLEASYARAPFFARYAPELREVYTGTWTSLVELDLQMLDLARRWLEIRVPIVRASSLALEGHGTDRLIDLCRKVGARAYLAGGSSATSALDSERMGRSGVGVIWQQFAHPVYPQRFPDRGFDSHLGFLDLLFNCGDASRDVLFDHCHPVRVRGRLELTDSPALSILKQVAFSDGAAAVAC